MGWIDSTKISLVSDMLDGIGMYFLQELSESAMAMIIELFLSSFCQQQLIFMEYLIWLKLILLLCWMLSAAGMVHLI